MVAAFTIVNNRPPSEAMSIFEGPPNRYMKKRNENGVESIATRANGLLRSG